jgi:hypothetical protein
MSLAALTDVAHGHARQAKVVPSLQQNNKVAIIALPTVAAFTSWRVHALGVPKVT